MNSSSRIVLRAALLLGIAPLLAASPAAAQDGLNVTSPNGRAYNLSKAERAAIVPMAKAMAARDYAAAAAALPAAKAGATGGDARYLVASEQLRLAVATNNRPMQADAIDAMIDSGIPDASVLPDLLRNQAALATSAGNPKKAEAALSRLVEMTPNDVNSLMSLAKLRSEQRNFPGAVALIDRAIEVQKASGQPVAESWYKYGLNYSMVSSMTPQALKFARGLVTAYPSSKNWRDALLAYRDLAKPDKLTELDTFRLMRLTKALSGERDFIYFADTLSRSGFPAETKAVLDEGVAANMIDGVKPPVSQLRKAATAKVAQDKSTLPSLEKSALARPTGDWALSTGDTFFGYGDYAKAAALYRAALQKGSVDASVVNTRLGMALALAGQKAEAEAAFKAVGGNRAELGNFFLLWLSQRA